MEKLINDKELEFTRTEIRQNNENNDEKIQKIQEQFNFYLSNLQDIQRVSPKLLIAISNFILKEKFYTYFAKMFPYEVYFRLLVENPNEKVKLIALKQLSFFSQFPEFPFAQLINSQYMNSLFSILTNSGNEKILSPILNIFTMMLQSFPEMRDTFLNLGILDIVQTKLISPKIPAFLFKILIITPTLPQEICMKIEEIFIEILKKIDTQDSKNYTIVGYAIEAINKLIEMNFPCFDYSFLDSSNLINKLLGTNNEMIICSTITLITRISCPTIQYSQACLEKMIGFQNHSIIHLLLNLFIVKYDEWSGFQDLDEKLIELCLQYSNSPTIGFDDKLLCLRTLLLYYPFDKVYDSRMCDILIEFLSYPKMLQPCIEKLMLFLNISFESLDSYDFAQRIEDSNDTIQSIIDENSEYSNLMSNFMVVYEKWKTETLH